MEMMFNLFYGLLISAAVSGFLVSLFGSVCMARSYKKWRGAERVLVKTLATVSMVSTIVLGARVIRIAFIGPSDTLRAPPFDFEFWYTILVFLLTIIALCVPATVGYFTVHRLKGGDE